MKLSKLLRFAPAITATVVLLASQPVSQAASSFKDLNIEYGELKLALGSALAENKQLRESLAENANTLTENRQNLFEATAESATFKTQLTQIRLRMEALGVNAASGGNGILEQRLLSAINDLRAIVAERAKLSEAIIRLVDASSLYVKTATAGNPESRLTLESEIRNSDMVISASPGDPIAAPESEGIIGNSPRGRVVSVRDDLSLVVLNVGVNAGMRLGMPLQITRNDQVIGNVRVVDVRQKIVGAVIQNLSSEKSRIKVGDHLKLVAEQQIISTN